MISLLLVGYPNSSNASDVDEVVSSLNVRVSSSVDENLSPKINELKFKSSVLPDMEKIQEVILLERPNSLSTLGQEHNKLMTSICVGGSILSEAMISYTEGPLRAHMIPAGLALLGVYFLIGFVKGFMVASPL